jgi:hypothetical protein
VLIDAPSMSEHRGWVPAGDREGLCLSRSAASASARDSVIEATTAVPAPGRELAPGEPTRGLASLALLVVLHDLISPKTYEGVATSIINS